MAPTRKNSQTGDGNNRGSLARTLSDAQDMKARGNSFFRQGKYKEAVEEYRNAFAELITSTGPNPDTIPLMVTLRSNLAACFLEMEQYEQAVDWARAAVYLDPLHLKSYRKLCKAQHFLNWTSAAVETMSVVVALTLPNRLDDDMLPIFNELAGTKPLPPGTSGLQFGYQLLPGAVSEYACAASDRELQHALSAKKKVVVLKPGSYSGCLGSLQLDFSLTLIGLGKVDITGGPSGHSLHLICGQLHARHLNLIGEVRSAICVGSEHANLILFESKVEDHKGQGVLIIGGQAYLQGCTFRNLGKQAVEVRGGSVRLIDCHINKCRQGVAISGGLKVVEINDCKIEDVSREGLIISGKHRSEASSIEFGLEELRANLPSAARRGMETADSTLLEVKIVDSVVKGCRSYGLLLDDMDANVSIVNSKLVGNGPAACYVKVHSLIIVYLCSLV